MAEQAPFYIFTAFIFSYGTGTLQVSRDLLLIAGAGRLARLLLSPFPLVRPSVRPDRAQARLHARRGRSPAIYGFVYFGLLNTLSPVLIFIAIVLSLIPHDMLYGPQAALIAECFTPRLRYSGASVGYQLASIIAGGPAPLIAAWLFARTHSGYTIAWFILACGVITLIATAMMPDYTGKDISEEYDRGAE